MSWSKIETDFKKPLGWWFHKIMCEIAYSIKGSSTSYYFHLNSMCDKYKITLYGHKIN